MNSFLGVMWGLIDPDMFASMADMLEDIMQASVPGVIENVRVAAIDQGTNPIRILSLRALPDNQVQEMKDEIHRQNKENKDPQEAAADEEGGDYYNLECSFAYRALPTGGSTSARAKNMHMQLVFYLGVKGLFGGKLFIEHQCYSAKGYHSAITYLRGTPGVGWNCATTDSNVARTSVHESCHIYTHGSSAGSGGLRPHVRNRCEYS